MNYGFLLGLLQHIALEQTAATFHMENKHTLGGSQQKPPIDQMQNVSLCSGLTLHKEMSGVLRAVSAE